jgi:hypothetical protein
MTQNRYEVCNLKGSSAGYRKHQRENDVACTECKEAHAIEVRNRNLAKRGNPIASKWLSGNVKPRPSFPEAFKNRRTLLGKYQLTLEMYDSLLDAQGYVCATCATPWDYNQQTFSVDHDHSCCPNPAKSCGECIRGLLCQRCNMALGLLADNVETLLRAVNYLSGESNYTE